MIEQLNLRDFQAHRRLRLDVAPGVTTLVGPTDAGKSAVLRALRWLALNWQPRGVDLGRRGSRGARVHLRADGAEVVRTRRRGRNEYWVGGRRFAAFGRTVPEEVQQLLGVSDLNFQGQHDPPFWLTESPPELARRLNEVVDLSLVDRVLGRLQAKARATQAKLEVCEERCRAARERRATLRWARGADRELRQVEAGQARLVELGARVQQLDGALQRIEDNRRSLEGIGKDLRGVSRGIQQLERAAAQLQAAEKAVGGLREVISQVGRARAREEGLRAEVVAAEAELQTLVGTTCPLCGQPTGGN